MFLGTLLWGVIGFFAATGFYEMIQGHVQPPSSALFIGWIIGSGVGALTGTVKGKRIGASPQREHPQLGR
jgi:hypothetical protein